MEGSSSASRPHVMALSFPAQSHLTAMMYFARKLAARGIVVTFVTTQYNLQRMLQAAGGQDDDQSATSAAVVARGEEVRLLGLDDGLPEDDPRLPTCVDTLRAFESLGGRLEQLLQQVGGLSPPITCLVSDSFLPWSQPIALKCGVPRALFWTQSLAVCSSYWCTSKLISSGYDPFLKQVKCRGERPLIGFIPGLPNMDPYDLPFNAEIVLEEENENTKWLRSNVESQFTTTINDATWFIANSFEELEGSIARALYSTSLISHPKLLLLGPLCNDLPLTDISLSRASLWKEDDDGCLSWLDTQHDASILYISFGSIVARADVVHDMAMALLACKQPFLWARQSGWEDVRESLSDEFLGFTTKVGKLTTWIPQLKVLSHRAIGGFFTHAGWSSTIESISRGVPMIAWPSFLDQYTNSWAISCLWKIGVQVIKKEGSDLVHELESAICTLMQGNESIMFRERVAQLASVSSNSNCKYLNLFIDDMFKRANMIAQPRPS